MNSFKKLTATALIALSMTTVAFGRTGTIVGGKSGTIVGGKSGTIVGGKSGTIVGGRTQTTVTGQSELIPASNVFPSPRSIQDDLISTLIMHLTILW